MVKIDTVNMRCRVAFTLAGPQVIQNKEQLPEASV